MSGGVESAWGPGIFVKVNIITLATPLPSPIITSLPADKLNKEPTSLYIQPLPAIDLCLQPAVLQWSLSSLQLTSANKGIILRLEDYLCANFRGLEMESQVPKVQ